MNTVHGTLKKVWVKFTLQLSQGPFVLVLFSVEKEGNYGELQP